ncbi:MAG: hypothetical protein ACK55Z_01130, partial [bacterium]
MKGRMTMKSEARECWLEPSLGRGCCFSRTWRPVRSSPQRKRTTTSTSRKGSARSPQPLRERWK